MTCHVIYMPNVVLNQMVLVFSDITNSVRGTYIGR